MSSLNLADIDLVRTPAIPHLEVEIEGEGKLEIDLPVSSLLKQIVHAYAIFSGRVVTSNDHLEKRVTVVALDIPRRYIKVQIAN